MEWVLVVALVVTVGLLFLNRKELLKVIKDKEVAIDSYTREVTVLQEDSNKYLIQCQELCGNLERLTKELELEREKNQIVISQKKSSETKLGQISEHLIPFLEKFNHDPKEVRFLGSPIDLIAFNFEEPSIYFIEVKTGNAQESKRQKLIKNAIKMGRVYYEKIVIGTNGVKVKTEKNLE